MYFDNAATSFPKPECVYREMDRFLRTAGANPGRSGHRMAVEADAVIARTRRRLAQLLNAPRAEQIVFTANCTEGINLVLKGLLEPGDRVVATAMEHNAIARPLRALEKRGVRVTVVPSPGGKPDLDTLVETLTPGTRLLALAHASNVTGAVAPIAELGAVCRERGIRFLVDAAQTAGALPLDVREVGADFVAMPGHKALLGPPGTGALYIGQGITLRPLREGGTGSLSEQDEQPEALPDRFEAGTLNSVGIAGLGAALAWIGETGRETIRMHERALVARLWEGLSEVPGVRLYGPPPGEERAAVVSFNLDGWEPTDAAQVLDQSFDVQCRPGLHCAPRAHRSLGTFPSGTIRLSPGYFNTEAEVEAVVEAVTQMCMGAKRDVA